VMNLSVIQPLAHELFLRGLLLAAVVRHMGWGWGIAATLIVEMLLRLNIAWVFQTLLYAGAMLGLYYATGNALCGLTAAMTAGTIQAAVLLKRAVAAQFGPQTEPS
jgi:membrane protease YdiL (CAAX protease family)